jgi:hypothetical protein
MADEKSAFFDQETVDKWDARETGQALKPILAKIGRMNRTNGNADQITQQLVGDPDALSGLEHLREKVREATR